MITVIHGPMASGKTFHSARFRSHYRCVRIVDDWDQRPDQLPADNSLILTTLSPDWIRQKHGHAAANMRFVSIATARAAIGEARHWKRK